MQLVAEPGLEARRPGCQDIPLPEEWNRDLVQEEEQLMEEKKKKKDDKKKKEAAQKKATEQKIKVPEQIKPSVSQPQPANSNNGTSTATSTNNNAKRATANSQQPQPQPQPPPPAQQQPPQQQQQQAPQQQPQALPRYPREVPPRFRHQEHKQLLKRGQHFPVIAAKLGSAVKVLSSQSESSAVTAQQPQNNGEVQSSKTQSDTNHSTSGPHYERSQQGPVSPPSDSRTDCRNAAVDDLLEKEAWPSVPGSDPELASECVDADSASSSESERNITIMASGSTASDKESLRSSAGLGSQNKFVVGSSSNNVGHGGSPGPWGFSHGAIISTCQVSVDAPESKSESSNNRVNAWGTVGSSSNGGLNPSTLNSASNHGAWPVLDNNGLALKGPVGSGSSGINIPCSTIGQLPNNQSINSKVSSSSTHGTWGSLQETCESEVSGTQKVSFSGQPQNIATEMSGPNNTTNFMTSSLPNSGSVQNSELPGSNTGAWRLSTMNHPQIQAPSVMNGTSLSHLSNGESKSGGSYGTTWAAYGSSYSGDKCSGPGGQANGDTVNATLMQPGVNGPVGTNFQVHTSKGGGVWESGAANPQSTSWGNGNGANSGGSRRGWGAPAQNTGTNVPSVEWNKLPSNQHSNDSANGNAKKFTNGWKSAEEEDQGSATSQTNEQNSVWAKTGGAVESEGSTESTGRLEEKAAGESQSRDRRKVDQHTFLQSIVNRTDLDPRVLSNSGWGQTPIKQNTAWDTETSPREEGKTDNGTEAWGGSATQTFNSGACIDKTSPSNNDTSSVSGWGDPKPALRWGDSKGSNCQGGWEDDAAATGMIKSNQWGNCKEEKSTWNDSQKSKQGWGDGQKPNQGWSVSAGDGWGDTSRSNHWGETNKKSSSGGSDSDRSVSGWNELGKTSSFTWGNNINPNNSSGWDESSKPNPSQGWGDPPKSNQSLGWGDSSKPVSSPDWNKQQDIVGSWGIPAATGKPPGTGWLGGPIPAPAKEEEPTGWEEPSPESIRRKMEVDDGTSAWGDPSKYNYKNVNMWNKNVPNGGSRADQQAQVHQLLPPAGAMADKEASGGSGWGEPWGEPSAPATTVDNGTSAWGKPADSGPSWGEPLAAASSTSTWGSSSAGPQVLSKSGPKSMQDGWCGDDMPLPGSRPPGWEEEEDVEIGMWNSNSSQELNSSLNWPPYTKKMSSKGLSGKKRRRERGMVKGGNKQEEAWVNPFVKQFSSISFARDSPEENVQSNKMDLSGGMLQDKRMEIDKHSLSIGDYNRTVGKGPGPRPQISKESSMERNPYFDKNGNPSVFGVGNTAAQPRGMQQPPAQPLSSSQPNLRAQVPPPLLSPQVPVSLLKYAPNNGGLNPLFGPQQVAMLNQLSQLNQLTQISQLQRLLVQQQRAQSQRSVPSGNRQQQDQQGRPLSVQQQMMQQSRQLDPNLLVKQQTPPSQQQSLHQPAVKSFLDNVLPHTAPELQKGPSPISAFSNFPIGLNSNLNVNMDMNSIKEPQSRLRKWTTVDSISVSTSLDQNSSKHGAISSGFRLEESPFVPYDFVNSSTSPASPPGSIGDGWPRAKSPNGSSSVNWPPEFRPGEPWKGYPNIDPETDPYVTPGSVINNLSINTVREVDHLRDRNSGSSSSLNTTLPSTSAWSSIRASNYSAPLSSTAQSTSARNSDSKLTWSPGSATNTSLAHELWKVPLPPKSITAPSRPPPGLTGSSWGESSSGRITNCLVLKNLTPQIDGSTLRTLCMQHGPLITFHLNLPHGNALVRYSSKEEVVKAQKSLHMCVLGNTTILAEFASEEEISRFFAQSQSLAPSPGWQSLGAGQGRLGALDCSHSFSSRADLNHWNGAGLSGTNCGELHGASLWGAPHYSTSLWGPPSGGDPRGIGSPSPLNAFLSVEHLGGGGESL
ncbi:PREDICTED: trinucleotide repeat-containing gene 6A protein isoform X7 [Chinchilla lanigera]|uniref:trinucleotide repeat-containing gene 6A protein isoform X7 n=1 Tax=Chinchilla lanigera TaxID=34839 RepID=UPI0006975B74|nr:PREDICTED: trinucleotide repeat-containing gene 6A protein isoform X7 [Chinchilla lanigera]